MISIALARSMGSRTCLTVLPALETPRPLIVSIDLGLTGEYAGELQRLVEASHSCKETRGLYAHSLTRVNSKVAC
jgi:hypothetical protein